MEIATFEYETGEGWKFNINIPSKFLKSFKEQLEEEGGKITTTPLFFGVD